MAKLRVNEIAAVGVSTENTGSVFFDGTGDNLVSKSSGLAPGSGSFTAEGWFNLPSTSGISNSSLFSSGIEPVLHWALTSSSGTATDAQSEPDTWNRIDVGVGTYAAGFLYQDSSTLILLDVGITTTSVTLDFSTELDEDFYYPGWLVSNDFVNNGWINKGAVNTDADGVVTLTDSTPFRYVKMRSLTNYVGNVATLQGYSPLDGADYAAWGVRRSSDNGNAYLYDGADWVDTGLSISEDTWNHVAVVRDSSAMNLYVNGTGYALTSYTNSNLSNSIISVSGFNTSGNVVVDPLRGYASNVRLTLEKELYTSKFTPPTTELEVIGGTAFVGCYDGDNLFAEKTGKYIAAHGDRSSSPTPTATDSPIGISTFNPGLVRSVNVSGPTFEGGVGYNSQNWLTLPKGTTTQRSSGRGIYAGQYSNTTNTGSGTKSMQFWHIPSGGTGQDFGDLVNANSFGMALSSATRGVIGGGFVSPAYINVIEYVTIAATGNAVDFGDLLASIQGAMPLANSTRGIFGGDNDGLTIDFITIATLGNAQDFGDFSSPASGKRENGASFASPTRGIFAGGKNAPSGFTNAIDYITISTLGDTTNFGDLLQQLDVPTGCSSSTRGVIAGGTTPTYQNTIQYITISTLGDASDFGDLREKQTSQQGMTNSIRGVFDGGYAPSNPTASRKPNIIDFVTIASTGNSVDFGDMGLGQGAATVRNSASDSHGGLS
tara:strand:- start:31 stop:2175 length:2145 start_codon:yes stop_codon:yes gene_type:complete